MLGVVLLYVGAVLVINGLWLIGRARAAAAGMGPSMEAEAHPLFMQDWEVTIINIFTGFVGVVAAVTLIVQGTRTTTSRRSAGAASSCCSRSRICGLW